MVAELEHVKISAPEGDSLHKLIKGASDIDLDEGDPSFELSFKCPKGSVQFAIDKPQGMKFPGFEPSGSKGGDDDLMPPTPDFEMPSMPDLLPVTDHSK